MNFEVLDLLRIPVSLLNALALAIFFSGLLAPKYNSRILYAALFIIYFIISSVISIFATEFAVVLTFFVCLLFPLLLYGGSFIQRLICGGLVAAYSLVAECFVMVSISYFLAYTVEEMRFDTTSYYIGAYTSALLLLCIAIIIVKRRKAKLSAIPNKYYVALLIAVWICAGLAFADMQTLEQSGNPATLAFLLSEAGIAVLSVLVFIVFESYQKHAEQREHSMLLEKQLRQDEQRYKLIDDQHREIAAIRHDMINHLTSIGRLLSDGQYSEAKAYVNEYYSQTSPTLVNSITGKPSVDALIAEKNAIAERENIQFVTETGKLTEIMISPYHLNIILSNALDNAIEACKVLRKGDNPYILLGMKTEGDNLCIRVKNPAVKPRFAADGLPITSKEDSSRHGFGLSSIKRIIEIYDGTILCEHKDGVFVLYIHIMNTPEDVESYD